MSEITSEIWRKYGVPSHSSKRRLVTFLYCLARDELPMGAIESVWLDHVRDEANIVEGVPSTECEYSNGWLAQWAENFADRLLGNFNEEQEHDGTS